MEHGRRHGDVAPSYLRVADDGGVEADNVLTGLHDVPPPGVLDVLLQLHAQRAVVEEPRKTVVNLLNQNKQEGGSGIDDQWLIRGAMDVHMRYSAPTSTWNPVVHFAMVSIQPCCWRNRLET